MATDEKSYTDTWLKSQQAYWDAWFQFCQQASGTDGHNQGGLAWAKGLESWWSGLGGELNQPAQDFFQRIVDQGKSFLGLSEKFTALFKDGDISNWQATLQTKIAELNASFAANPGTFDPSGSWMRLLPFFELPMDTWNRTLSSAALFPGDFLKTVKNDNFSSTAEHVRSHLGQFLSIPGVGYTREWQEGAQQSAKLFLEYDQAFGAYNQAHARLGIDALELLRDKTVAKAAAGEEIKSLRQLYDLWVDCGEEAYSKFAFSEEYGVVYGRLINALMRLKKHNQQMIDEVAGSLNLPTNQGLSTIQCRQQELRRELSRLRTTVNELSAGQDGTASVDMTAMHTQLQDLTAKVMGLQRSAAQDATTQDVTPGLTQADGTASKPSTPKRNRTTASPPPPTREAVATTRSAKAGRSRG
jgi:polyhydroxyalkanoate synthase subunit PhaE